MPRFFVQGQVGNTPCIMGEDARHIALSLRCKIGEKLTLCDGQGMDYDCHITGISPNMVELEVASSAPSRGEPPVAITLYQALPKGDKLEWIVQKAVELGVAAIQPVLTQRCIVRPNLSAMYKKQERLQKIALEAAKQSGRGIIPQIGALLSWEEALAQIAQVELVLFAWEEACRPLGPLLASRPQNIALLVGSEGGFSAKEAEDAQNLGAIPCTLGPRILRCETAPLYALSAITYTYENWEGNCYEK